MVETPPLGRWEPLSVAEASSVFAPLGVRWWIAGGWAIDLFLGRQTREHADIDIAMLRGDHLALRGLISEFDLYIAHDGQLTPWDSTPLSDDHHQFWASRRGSDSWTFEVLLEKHAGEQWLFRRTPEIALALDAFGLATSDGVPFVVPQVALLYKAKWHEIERNDADFAVAAPALGEAQRAWLCDALRVAHGHHPWIERLLSGGKDSF